ncbi:MAG TPA: hypothetical protein VN181_15960, partial [Thermoanaerobaculia bacterium]|nr:hypothetical protein [Thermoanaerobaculia bacterium]
TYLGVTYELPIKVVRLFAQAKMVNVFNNQGQINGEAGVLIARNSTCLQTVGANKGKRCVAFNPFTDTPVEGVNYVLGTNAAAQNNGAASNFGTGRFPTTSAGANLLAPNGDFQLPRTYLFSFGLRF